MKWDVAGNAEQTITDYDDTANCGYMSQTNAFKHKTRRHDENSDSNNNCKNN